MKAVVLALAIFAMTDLAEFADRSNVRLVTIGRKSGEPREVTIWFVAHGGRVFVQAGKGGRTDWFRNLERNAAVTLVFDDRRIAGKATVIADEAEITRVRVLFRKKYWLARVASWVGSGIGSGRPVRIDLGG